MSKLSVCTFKAVKFYLGREKNAAANGTYTGSVCSGESVLLSAVHFETDQKDKTGG